MNNSTVETAHQRKPTSALHAGPASQRSVNPTVPATVLNELKKKPQTFSTQRAVSHVDGIKTIYQTANILFIDVIQKGIQRSSTSLNWMNEFKNNLSNAVVLHASTRGIAKLGNIRVHTADASRKPRICAETRRGVAVEDFNGMTCSNCAKVLSMKR